MTAQYRGRNNLARKTIGDNNSLFLFSPSDRREREELRTRVLGITQLQGKGTLKVKKMEVSCRRGNGGIEENTLAILDGSAYNNKSTTQYLNDDSMFIYI